jgi:hypothetical protein
MAKACPISSRRIDTHLVRFISAQISIITILLIYTKLPIFALILFMDFCARGFRKPGFSPFFNIAKLTMVTLRLRPKMTDEAPKRFALFMGLAMSFVLSLLYISNYFYIGSIVAVILVTCALLETLFDFCLGCKIYQIIQKFKRN